MGATSGAAATGAAAMGAASGGFATDHRIAASDESLVTHGIPILGLFPHVAGHVEQAVTVSCKETLGCEGTDGRRAACP
jgi:hypothetical protein